MKRIAIISIFLLLAAFAAGCDSESDRPITSQGGPGFQQQGVNVDSQVQLLRDMLKNDPKNVQAWIKLGNITMDANRFDEAIEAYGKALEIDPTNVDVRVDRGTCFRQINRPDQAVEHFRKAIEINPNHPIAHMNLGVVLGFDLRRYDEATKELEKYLQLSPAAANRADIEQIIQEFKTAEGAHPTPPAQGTTP